MLACMHALQGNFSQPKAGRAGLAAVHHMQRPLSTDKHLSSHTHASIKLALASTLNEFSCSS